MGRGRAGDNGEAAPRVCVPANAVSEFIGLLYAIADQSLLIRVVYYYS